MQHTSSLRRQARSTVLSLILLGCACGAGAQDTYNLSTGQLSVSSMTIGNVFFANVVVTVSGIVSPPTGTTPNGYSDIYDPATNRLAVPSVRVGTATYTNVVVTVGSLISIGTTSADSYANSALTIPELQSGGNTYAYSTATYGGIVSYAGGMPKGWQDAYDPSTSQLTVPAIQVGKAVYTNAVIRVGQMSLGAELTPQTVAFTPPAALAVGASEPLGATASSGIPVGYFVTTPGVCAVSAASSLQYFYFTFASTQASAAPVSGSGVLGGISPASGVFFVVSIDGSVNGQPVTLLPTTTPWVSLQYSATYLSYASGNYLFDDVLYNTGSGQFLDSGGLGLTVPGNGMNIGGNGGSNGYYYVDDSGELATLTFNATPVSGLVGLAPGTCNVAAFANGFPFTNAQTQGGAYYANGAPVTYSVAVTAAP